MSWVPMKNMLERAAAHAELPLPRAAARSADPEALSELVELSRGRAEMFSSGWAFRGAEQADPRV